MKREETARYARWSAGVALVILLAVAGVYLHGLRRSEIEPRRLPPPVPPAVREQSSVFTYSKTLKDQTLFTVRASRATEYRGKRKSLLEDVSISIYGPHGDRNDSVHARECSYDPLSNLLRCQGTVEIDLEDGGSVGQGNAGGLHLRTSNISFDRQSGRVSAQDDVSLRFPGGEGRGKGIVYDSHEESVRLERAVELTLAPSAATHGLPVHLAGSALEYHRGDGTLRLFGPVRAREGTRVLTARTLDLVVNSRLHPRRLVASGDTKIAIRDAHGVASLTADQMTAIFGDKGSLRQVGAQGNVHGLENFVGGSSVFSANQVQLAMTARGRGSAPGVLTATGNVRVRMQGKDTRRNLTTDSLRVELAPKEGIGDGTHLARAETLTPAQLLVSEPEGSYRVQAGRLVGEFDSENRLRGLRGSSGVEIVRNPGSAAPQVTTAQTLRTTFGRDGAWETAEETGTVRVSQAGRNATAERARISRATDQIELFGTAVLADRSSETSAASIALNQKTGQVHAQGGVVTSYLPGSKGPAGDLGAGAAHISADAMTGSTTTGRFVYSGHARLWQGESVVEADRIELWRENQHVDARGDVLAVFPERPEKGGPEGPPAIWQVRAGHLAYRASTREIELNGGVRAQSRKGSISSERMEFFLVPGADGKQEVERAVALGKVRIEQKERLATAEQGEYFARDGKFVLFGGHPKLADASGNTTTGRELTFFLANDTILVNSKNGSRTITKHRIQK